MLFSGCISFDSAIKGITANTSVNPIKILTLFLSMTLISVHLGDAGFFDYVANAVFAKNKNGQLKLFLTLYAVISILTVFTSNDVIILTFTPPICLFCKKAKISPLPFLIGEFVAANTWSMMLIVGNPTNVYLAQSAGISFAQYVSVMWLPALIGGITGLLMVFILFFNQLKKPITKSTQMISAPNHIKIEKAPMISAIVHLLLCIILLALSDTIGFEMWLICLILALSLTIFDLVYDLIIKHSARPVWHSIKKEPFELIPFVLSMFVIVLALKENGITTMLSDLLITNGKKDAMSIGFISALSANLLNNIPMSVFFEGVIAGQSLPALYGAIIGSNVGAFITPVGALAGIMWTKILADYDVKLPFLKFVAYGSCVALPTILTSCTVLMLIV
jgi:arsenical pump membrane protein